MIVEMAHVLVLGPRGILDDVIRALQVAGVLQIQSIPESVGMARVKKIPPEEADLTTERRMEEIARRLHDLLILLPTPDEIAPRAFAADLTSADFASRVDLLEAEVRDRTQRRLALEEERALLTRYERLVMALLPLRPELPGVREAETVGILVRRDRRQVLPLLEQEVARITHGVYSMLSRDVDGEQLAVLLTIPKERARDLSQLLFERAISEIKLPERYAGLPLVQTLALLLRRGREIPAEVRGIEAEFRGISRRWFSALREALLATEDRLARLRAVTRCGETDHAFVISGWVPARRSGGLAATLDRAFEGKVVLTGMPIKPEEYNDVPVFLENPTPIKPFELLLSLLPLPRYGSIDPTPYLAGFFPLFFGLMLGDVGLGAITLGLALLARVKRWGSEIGEKLTTIALACSASAIVFGFLFGEFFGGLGALFGLKPILFYRREAVLSFLGLALGLGALHITLGIGLSLRAALRHGKTREALARFATLALVLVLVVVTLARLGSLSPAVGRSALLVLAPLLVLAIVGEGLMAPLTLLTSLANILSYARLMALGIASVMLADVANLMEEILTPAAIGVTVAVLLHAINFAMGLFGPTIQALRLHYVEFFDKFYEGGGKPYAPLTLTA
jgi:V/A-type H+-transporting ATPase subunit I